jgi:hypothetical protein
MRFTAATSSSDRHWRSHREYKCADGQNAEDGCRGADEEVTPSKRKTDDNAPHDGEPNKNCPHEPFGRRESPV